jgi:transcriptional regulator with XRE-family HTH domain
VSQVSIGNWEQGKSIRHAFINKLAVALNVSSDFLLDDSQVITHTHTHTHTHTQAIENKNGVGEFEITIKAPNHFLEDWHRKMDFLINKFELPK